MLSYVTGHAGLFKFTRHRSMLVIYLVYNILMAFAIYTYTSPLFTYAREAGAGTMTIAVIGAVYGLSQMLVRIPMGILSDIIKKRKIFLVLGGLCSALSGIGLCFFSSPEWLILWRILAGLSISTWVISTVLFTCYFLPNKRAGALSLLSAANSVGILGGLLLGGIFTRCFRYHSSFILAAVGGSIAFILSFFIREVPPKSKTTSFRQLFRVSRNPLLWGVSLLALIITLISFATVFGFTPTFATDRFGCDGYQVGLLSAVAVMGQICTNLFLSNTRIFYKIDIRNLIIFGFGVTALCNLFIPLSPNLGILFLVQFFAGIGQGLVTNPLLILSIYRVDSTMRSSAMGFYQSIYGIGNVIGPIFMGGLMELLGSLAAGFYALAGIAALCSLLSFCLPKIRNA